ncbi:MAG TPA: PAS domain-containing protein [Candidatus Binatia bacterium]|nr:PAS domain-containing protein [Candidatus Binatia bacterium]
MDTRSFFDLYFEGAKVNSILIMDPAGTIQHINAAFTHNFGYRLIDLKNKSFGILFTEADQIANKPQIELDQVIQKGQADDDNYVINKSGHPILSTGESILVKTATGEKYIVKDIVNLAAKKYLKLFLTETEELLERIFETSTEVAMIVIDGSMKVVKMNAAFLRLFEIKSIPPAGSPLSSLKSTFWSRNEVRDEIRNSIVTSTPIKHKQFLFQKGRNTKLKVNFESKIIDKGPALGRQIFIIVEID